MAINQETMTSQTVKSPNQKKRGNLFQLLYQRLSKLNLQTWALILVVTSGGVGFTATSLLLKLPKSPNCMRIFWPIASASMRIYCAQVEGEKGTVDSLLRAITLVESLPQDHPLRDEIDRNVEEWAVEILNLAEEEFQSGKLEQAIAIAQKIPTKVHAYSVVEDRIERWRSLWQEGEDIFAQVEEQLKQSNWNQAFRLAVQLLNLDNKYWATTKYDETIAKIQLAKEESTKLDAAYVALRRGGIDNWLKAIEEAQKIESKSYAYQEAQNVISKAKDKLLDYVQTLIDNRNWYQLDEVANRIPEKLALNEEVKDWKALASAGIDAQTGTVESLQAAIISAQEIDNSSPLYQKSQELIETWKREVEDVAVLAKARDLAVSGTVEALGSAIAQAESISSSNPRYKQAQKEIRDWKRQVQVIEDQPILEQARSFASQGDLASLQQAIAKASLIGTNRALYPQAQEYIRGWTTTIQRQEDQPYLNQAISLARLGDYRAAIDSASLIRQGRVLYGQAQENIRVWRREIKAQEDLRQAYQIAENKTSEALVTAISIVRRIPSSTHVGNQSSQALDQWSYQLLALATEQANQGLLERAVQLARIIPPQSAAYGTTQAQIQAWQNLLAPPQPSPSPIESNTVTEINNPLPPMTDN